MWKSNFKITTIALNLNGRIQQPERTLTKECISVRISLFMGPPYSIIVRITSHFFMKLAGHLSDKLGRQHSLILCGFSLELVRMRLLFSQWYCRLVSKLPGFSGTFSNVGHRRKAYSWVVSGLHWESPDCEFHACQCMRCQRHFFLENNKGIGLLLFL